MFENFIINLKKSLPEALRKKLGGADDFDDEDDFEEIQQESDEGGEDDLEDDVDEDKQKKMKSMIIKVIVVIALGYFALDEFLLKDAQQSPITENTAQAPKPNKTIETETTAELPPVEAVVETPEVESESEVIAEVEAPPIENVNVLEKNEESIPTETVVQVQEELPPELPPETPQDQVISETRMGESTVDKKLDDLVDNLEQTASSNPVEEIKIPSPGESESSPSMMSKIVEEITETLPPVYDQVGRGLVYNCKDKFWACLDKPAYVICSKNQKFNKSKGNIPECVVADIYSSDEDCAKVQKHNVSTSAPTAFCQN